MTAAEAFNAVFTKDKFAMCFCQSKTLVYKVANSFQFSKCDDCGDTYATLDVKYTKKIADFTKDENAAVTKAKADAAAKAAAKGTSKPSSGGAGSGTGSGTGNTITHAYPTGLNQTIKQAFIDYVYPTYFNDADPFDDEVSDIGKVLEHETLAMVSEKYESKPTGSLERRELKLKITSHNMDSVEMAKAIKDIITGA